MSVKAYMEDKIWYNLGQILLSSSALTTNASDRLYSPQPLLLILTVDRVEVRMVYGSLQVWNELVMAMLISILGQWFAYEASTALQ